MNHETRIQRRILTALSKEFHPLGMFWRNNTGRAKSFDGRRVIPFGLLGSADIIGALCGRAIGVEVKTDDGQQGPDQIAFQAAWERAGGVYVIARSPAEAIEELRRLIK